MSFDQENRNPFDFKKLEKDDKFDKLLKLEHYGLVE